MNIEKKLLGQATKYSDNGIKESLVRNGHMNDYEKEDFDEIVAKELVIQFVKHASPSLPSSNPKISDIAFGLARHTPFADDCGLDLPKVVKEAIVVDFTNYVAASHCMDLAMYTRDIDKERVKNAN